MILQLSSKDLEMFIREHREKNYQIVDVRRQEEFRLDHIPGSVNIPLAEIQFDPYMFENDKKLVFYCRSGRRSQVAAIFVAETGYPDGDLYNLKNGMLEYSGEVLLDYPRVDLLPAGDNPVQVMTTAIDFEKGAYHFYSKAKEKFKPGRLFDVMSDMVQEEVSHAKAIYNHLKIIHAPKKEFDTFFEDCSCQILEGGKSIDEVVALLESSEADLCLDILEFAIELEYCAYDLYKTTARQTPDKSLKKMLLSLAQAEKKHLDTIIQSLELCEVCS